MPIIIGLILIPIVVLIIQKSNMVTTPRKQRILLNILLAVISLVFIIFCFLVNSEPFDFGTTYSIDYMIYEGMYVLYSGLIFAFSPFMWIIVVHYLKIIYRILKIRKNSTLKGNEEYICYRGDLDKISPSLIMFTSNLELDLRKCISSTILKLKLRGYIEEKDDSYIYTNKDESELLDSEKMVLRLIRSNQFDKNEYIKTVENETLKNKFIVKNRGGILARIAKIILALCIPVIAFSFSSWLDKYVFNNYHVWPEEDGHAYIELNNRLDIERLEKEVKDENDYYHRTMNFNGKEEESYSYNYIRADKLKYSIVRKAFFLHILTSFMVGFEAIFVVIGLYIALQQIIYIKKGYRITIKGKGILNKAYALKNYLKNYSLINQRTEKELILWEYYLVYAVILDVNIKIEDELIEKYVNIFV